MHDVYIILVKAVEDIRRNVKKQVDVKGNFFLSVILQRKPNIFKILTS